MTRRPLPLGLAAGALLLCPAASSAAPAGTVLLPCVSNAPGRGADEPLEADLVGGAPGAPFTFLASLPGGAAGSVGTVSGTYDGDGNATPRITRLAGTGTRPTPGRTVSLAVRDGAGAVTPIGETLVTNLALDVAARPRRASARRLLRVSGTPFAGQALSAFVVRGRGTKVLRRIALGTADECGYVRRSATLLSRRSAPGAYRVYVGPGTKLRRADAVFRTFRVS